MGQGLRSPAARLALASALREAQAVPQCVVVFLYLRGAPCLRKIKIRPGVKVTVNRTVSANVSITNGFGRSPKASRSRSRKVKATAPAVATVLASPEAAQKRRERQAPTAGMASS